MPHRQTLTYYNHSAVRLNPFTQSTTSLSASATLSREIESPLEMTAAFGYNSAIVSMVPVNPLPPWVINGIMVLPLKSYVSRKV